MDNIHLVLKSRSVIQNGLLSSFTGFCIVFTVSMIFNSWTFFKAIQNSLMGLDSICIWIIQ